MAKKPAPDVTGPLEPDKVWQTLTDVQMSGLGSLSWLGTRWVETMSDIGAEWLNFVAERVREDVKTQHALLHAKSLPEIHQIQADFLQKAMDDYHDETGKIVQFCNETMEEIRAKADEAKDQPKT